MRIVLSRQTLVESRAFLVGLTTVVYAISVLISEKISIGGGFGFDGLLYGEWARTFPAPLLDGSMNQYYVQRIGPSALAHASLRLLRLDLTPENIIRAFEGLAIGLVCAAAWIWTALARRLHLTTAARWFGAVALLGSHAALKWTAYYPVLTDLWSVVIALLQLLFFLDRRLILLALATFAGAFIWPTTVLIGIVLIVFLPLRSGGLQAHTPPIGRLRFVLAGLAAVTWTLVCVSTIASGYAVPNSAAPLCRPLLRVSMVASAAFAFGAASILVDDRTLFDRRLIARYVLRPNLLVGALTIVAAKVIQARLAPVPSPHALSEFLGWTVRTSLQKPAVFLVAHVMFFGPVLLLIVMRARAVMNLARRWGPGLVCVASLGSLLFLGSESRHLWNVEVMFVPFAIKLLDDLAWTPRQFLALGAWTLVFSKVWLTYEDPIWPDVLELPAQLFFMTDGPWMNFTMYALQAAAVAGLGLWLARQLAPAHRLDPAAPPFSLAASPDRVRMP
jgi:hypothetical protein